MPRRTRFPNLLSLIAWLLIALSCALPLAWLVWQVAGSPRTLRLLHPQAIRWDILARTAGYSAAAAIVAGLLALPAGLVVGRRRSLLAKVIAFSLPLTLLLPSLMYAYGWAQFFRLMSAPLGRLITALQLDPQTLGELGLSIAQRTDGPHLFLAPAGPADVARCIFSLAAWLWPIPAAAIAWALRRADPAIRQQALLDGATARVTFRQTLPAAIVGMLAVWVLASQEFAVYEPTGVSVVATEVRMVFETGSFSSGGNPITAPMGGMMFSGGDVPTTPGVAPPALPMPEGPQDVQQRAAAAAVATGVPMLLLTAAIGVIVVVACRRWSAESDEVHVSLPTAWCPPPVRRGRVREGVHAGSVAGQAVVEADQKSPEPEGAPTAGTPSLTLPRRTGGGDQRRTGGGDRRRTGGVTLVVVAAIAVLALTVGVPLVALILRHQRPFDLSFIWREFDIYILGSLFNACLAGIAAIVVAAGGLQRRPRLLTAIALASFLVGGQLLAIALIRLYNRPHLGWVYNAPPIMVMAYLGRFGWLALLAAGATWSRPWRLLRQQAELDGGAPATVAWRIVLPLAWPLVVGAGLLVLVLSMTEVPATVLVTPLRPPQIVPMLMTWVHTLESDPMIEASLLLALVTIALGSAGVLLIRLGRGTKRIRSEGDVV